MMHIKRKERNSLKRLLKKKILVFISLIVIIVIIINSTNIKKIIYNNIYPKKYSYEVEKYAKEYSVDENLIYAVIKAESNFDKNAVSRKNAKGLMQLMYDTAVDIANTIGIEINEEKILEPDTNINIGTKYISILINKYNNIEVALAAYNAGSGNVDNWIANGVIQSDGSDIENIPFNETNNYVRKILRDYRIYCKK
ncbi:MAG: lytic transglycosylase domain-containing protein [Clostridia bacterium]|nr:lytic transglycosylase domain-containing protein [Clostridia bacterium]